VDAPTDMPGDAMAAGAGAPVFDGLLRSRWSCRGFKDTPLPRPTVKRLLEMAQRTPSWCNTQPWRVTLTSGEATCRLAVALSEHQKSGAADQPDLPFPAAYRGEYLARRRECGYQLYGAVGIERGDRARSAAQGQENFRFFGAPHFALITTERDLGTYGAIDCGGYVSVFLLAAQSLGLAAIPQAAVAAYSPWLRDYFGLPNNRLVVCGISFGLADRAHPANGFQTNRAPISEVVDWRE
jgi:nitroreductase